MQDPLKLQLCDIQGRLFELSLREGFASEGFIKTFMGSRCAADYDADYDRLQWMGEEYIMSELIEECGGKLVPGEQYSRDEMYWIGYTYRYWHFLTGESSKKILSQAPVRIMKQGYAGFHTEDVSMAIEDLKQLAESRKPPRTRHGPSLNN
ncbi:MAG: hypothetical protein LBP82_02055 [Candidatus Methanoplasma sp.]|jgi:hypothetical protein|nr:hypothetical protein [Candidatus Methanoplasma sp.]